MPVFVVKVRFRDFWFPKTVVSGFFGCGVGVGVGVGVGCWCWLLVVGVGVGVGVSVGVGVGVIHNIFLSISIGSFHL